ncbi:integrase, catalytic region, zinc finger, CCHC-type containing protein [Tanacetum coccineum]|uniref:Integrase, catalytic region, zinc finger, CCHC-type containing protein n=1 Tax=Tanacetum coccineum TaxID=301880 RepID=A0ABQ4Z8I8_9ASTR
MSNTNNNLQTQTSNALHNVIMEAGGKDRTPMLAPDNDIYSTFDAYPNACAMCKAIERLKQGESINVQDFETNLYQEFGKFTSRDGEKLKLYYSRFYKMMNELKIYKPTNNNLGTSSNTSRANQDNTPRINRGTGYDNQRVVNVVGARENVGTQVVQQFGIQCYNCKEYGHVVSECQKPKWAKDATYHKEKILLCKQEEARIQLSAEQIEEVTPDAVDNSRTIFDVEPLQKVQNDNDNYNVFANDREHPEQPEYVNVTYLKEHDDINIITDSLDMSNNGGEADQDDADHARERDLLASLIEKLKCEIDESKDRNKPLESLNKTLVDKFKIEIEDFKNKNKCLESSNNHFKEANNELAKNNQLMFKDLKKFQAKLDRYHDVNYAS